MNPLYTFWETRLRPKLTLRRFFDAGQLLFLESGEGYRLVEWTGGGVLPGRQSALQRRIETHAMAVANENTVEKKRSKNVSEKNVAEKDAAEKAKRDDALTSPVRFWVDESTLCWFAPESLCGGGETLLTLLCGGDFPPIGSGVLREAIVLLAARCGFTDAEVPEWTERDEREFIRTQRSSGIVEAYLWIAHRLLLVPDAAPASPAREFLTSLGMTTEDVRRLGLGFHAGHGVFRDGLARCGYTEAEVAASELISSPWLIGRLVGPIRDDDGVLRSLWAYLLQETFTTTVRDTQTPEFLFKGGWKDSIGLFGLPTATAALKMENHHAAELAAIRPSMRSGASHRFRDLRMVVVSASLIDTLRMQVHGFDHAVASAGGGGIGDVAPTQWRRAMDCGVRRFVYLTQPEDEVGGELWGAIGSFLRSRDAARRDGTLRADDVETGAELFLLSAAKWRKRFDACAGIPVVPIRCEAPGEEHRVLPLAKENELARLVGRDAVACGTWAAHRILARYRTADGTWDSLSRRLAWKEAVDFYQLFAVVDVVPDETTAGDVLCHDLLDRDFVPTIVSELGLDWATGRSLVGGEEDDPARLPTPEPVVIVEPTAMEPPPIIVEPVFVEPLIDPIVIDPESAFPEPIVVLQDPEPLPPLPETVVADAPDCGKIEPVLPGPLVDGFAPDTGVIAIELPPPPVEPPAPSLPEEPSTTLRRRPRKVEWCEVHQCMNTECFCFD